MRSWLAVYAVTGLVFLGLDAVWLTQAGPRLYRPLLDPLLAEQPRIGAAAAFYLIYVLGIVVLAVAPARSASLPRASLGGAVLGVVAYGAYDLTNQATLRLWATRITLLDMSWGALATAGAATAGLVAWRWARRWAARRL